MSSNLFKNRSKCFTITEMLNDTFVESTENNLRICEWNQRLNETLQDIEDEKVLNASTHLQKSRVLNRKKKNIKNDHYNTFAAVTEDADFYQVYVFEYHEQVAKRSYKS